MPLFYFRICKGDFSGTSGEGIELADNDAAWTEMTKVCGDLVGSIVRKLHQQSEWRMEMLDESRKPLFRIRVVAETLDQPPAPEIRGSGGVDIGVKISSSDDPSSS